MSFTVQDAVNGTTQDIRRQLAPNGSDASILVDYTNRVQLEILRSSRWKFTLAPLQDIATVTGSGDYWIGATGQNPGGTVDTGLNLNDVRVIKSSTVFDRTNYRRLALTDERPLSQTFVTNSRPRLYRNDSATPYVINLFPIPDGAYTIEFRYFRAFPQVAGLSDTLVIPVDYKDIVTAGVNYLAFAFLEDAGVVSAGESATWLQLYEKGKAAMIRDKNLFPRGGEYIAPDIASSGNLLTPPLAIFWDGRN